eukprot:2581429-Heterocapsa_arctica.AAC.1
MECGTLKGHQKEEQLAMDYACYLQEIKKEMNSEPQCLWTTGMITKHLTVLPETEHMKAEDIRLNCIAKS